MLITITPSHGEPQQRIATMADARSRRPALVEERIHCRAQSDTLVTWLTAKPSSAWNVPDNQQEVDMVRMFVRHTVRDYGAWRRGYNAFDRKRKAMGVKRQAVFRAVSNPKDVTVWHDFASLAKAKAFVRSRQLKEAMKAAGVKSAPTIWFVRAA
jgi:hypothetical protein